MRSLSASLRFFMRWMRIVSTGPEFDHRRDRQVEIAVFLAQLGKLAPDFAFFLVGQVTALSAHRRPSG